MIIGVPKENYPGERRVALVPSVLPALIKARCKVSIQAGAGIEAGYPDSQYADKGAKVIGDRAGVLRRRRHRRTGSLLRPQRHHGKRRCATVSPRSNTHRISAPIRLGGRRARNCADRRHRVLRRVMPRTTRAQSMDALSAMGTVSGYKAVLRGGRSHPTNLSMLTTAAGTVTPARVFVIGCGVAGLQAIATSASPGRSDFRIRFKTGGERAGAESGRPFRRASD